VAWADFGRSDELFGLDPALLSANTLVADVVMNPSIMAFLNQVRERGCHVQLGEAVMLSQLDVQVEFFRMGRASLQA